VNGTYHSGGSRPTALQAAPVATGQERLLPEMPSGHVTRRQMTVAFCDLVGSTELATRIEPEDMLDILSVYRALVQRIAARFGGFFANFIGDGIDLYFGYPLASEDDAVRAIHAGLEIVVQARKVLADASTANNIQVRVGIATGMVAVAGHEKLSIAGATPHLAARIQAIAQPGEVVVAPNTRRIAGGQFKYVDLGLFNLKGFDRAIPLSVVIEASALESRSAWRGRDADKPLVGRGNELTTLLKTCGNATSAIGVLVAAEPGMGKSHLVAAVAHQLACQGTTVVRLQCSPFQTNSALEPLAQHLAQAAGISRTDSIDVRREKLEAQLAVAGIHTDAHLCLLSSLLGLPGQPGNIFRELNPLARLQLTKEALLRYFAGLANVHANVTMSGGSRPAVDPIPLRLLLVIEDLHWMDPTTLELIRLMLASLHSPIALLMTARTEFTANLGADVPVVHLVPLLRDAAHLIACRVAADAGLPGPTIEAIVEHTDGVPLYIEEMTRMMVDVRVPGSEASVASGTEVPATLMDLLMERLDRLGPAKWLAQVASVLGHEFDAQLLSAASGLAEPSFNESLNGLLDAGLALATDGTREHFAFKHALMQDTAYISISARTRERIHARVADLLLRDYPDIVERQPERVARHLTQGGKPLQAASFWLLAGELALGRGAPREAEARLSVGLQSLARLAPDRTKTEAELALLSVLGPTTMVLKGPGSEAFRDVQQRAYALCHELPGAPRQFPITYGLCLYYWGRAELSTALELSDRLLKASQTREDDDEAVMAANNMCGMIRLCLGDVAAACSHLERSVSRYDPKRAAALYPIYLMDFGVFGRFYLAIATFAAGDAQCALRHTQDACELAQRLNQPHTLGFALASKCTMAVLRQQPDEALQSAEECIEFASRMGFFEFMGVARVARGWATGRIGATAEGLAELEAGIQLWNATGFENWQYWFGFLKAELLTSVGRREDALNELAYQLARIDKSGEALFRSLLLAQQGALLMEEPAERATAEHLFDLATQLAVRQRATAWVNRIEAQRRRCTGRMVTERL